MVKVYILLQKISEDSYIAYMVIFPWYFTKQMICSRSPDQVIQNDIQHIHIIRVWNFFGQPKISDPQRFFFDNFWNNKLETPNSAYSNFNNIHIGGCDQIPDPPQNLGGVEVQIWETVWKMSKL